MSSALRRYEVLVPLKFNDKSDVPDGLIGDTLLELRDRFGAYSTETQLIVGSWIHQGQTYSDELIRVFLDVPDVPESRAFFQHFKETLKARFKQLDIWIVSFPIEVV